MLSHPWYIQNFTAKSLAGCDFVIESLSNHLMPQLG